MADFTKFEKPTEEWQKHIVEHGSPPSPPIGQLTAEEIQKLTNDGREKISAQQMVIEGNKLLYWTFVPKTDVILSTGLIDKVSQQPIHITARDGFSIPAKIYRPESADPKEILPIYVFYHGGGFLYGTLSSEDAACSRIVASMPIVVINVCYRHAPQFPHPAAHNDAFDSFDWVVAHAASFGGDPVNIVLGGLSAGANLATSVTLNRTSRSSSIFQIRGLVLGIPWLVVNEAKFPYQEYASKDHTSRVQCAKAPVVSNAILDFFVACLGVDKKTIENVGVGAGGISSAMPSTSIMVAGNDPLRDDGILFAQELHRSR